MEQELKFALTATDPLLVEQQLARVPLIGRRKPKRQQLHSTYYDTPEHALQKAAIALRVRQIGDANHPHWVQTLKMGGSADSAFSRRGEWEHPLKANTLDPSLLVDTPWMDLDPDGVLFQSLSPVFTTRFERLSWIIKQGEFSAEVALDRGEVHMDGQNAPLCELEIELLSGSVDALFDAAAQIGQHLSLMPLHLSKAARAYRLAQGTLYAPLRAKPPVLSTHMDFSALAQAVLRESFLQFSANLYSLCSSDAPEVLHQTRVGWRRFKSALRLFEQGGSHSDLPTLAPLKPLLAGLAELRDLEVAASEVLPLYANAYQGATPRRVQQWQRLQKTLTQAIQQQRAAVRQSAAEPALGRSMLDITRWLEAGTIAVPAHLQKSKKHSAADWLGNRLKRLAKQLKSTPVHARDPAVQHQMRIVSKRLRYGVEGLRTLLPKKRAQRWHHLAVRTQTRIGLERDRQQAVQIAERLHAADGIVEFLRGAAFGSSAGPAEDGHCAD
jgi:inorganic triphosphatase YgiF